MSFLKSGFVNGVKVITSSDLGGYQHENFDKLLVGNKSKQSKYSDKESMKTYVDGCLMWIPICINRFNQDMLRDYKYINNKTGEEIKDIRKIDKRITIPIDNGYMNIVNNKKIKVKTTKQLSADAACNENLAGNMLWIKNQGSMLGEKINSYDNFIPISPGNFKVVLDSTNTQILNYEIRFANGKRFLLPPDQVIHFKRNALLSPFFGVGLVAQGSLAIDSQKVAQQYFREYVITKGTPDLIIEDKSRVPNYDSVKKKAEEIKELWEQRYFRNSVMWLSGEDINAKTIATNMQDIQFIDTTKLTRDNTIALMESTPVVLGLTDSLNNRATAIEAKLLYLDRINKRLKHIEETINSQHVWDFNENISLIFEKYNTGYLEDIIRAIEMGMITPEDGARLAGLATEGSEEQSKLYMRAGMIPLASLNELYSNDGMEAQKLSLKKKSTEYNTKESIIKSWKDLPGEILEDYKHEINGVKRNEVGATPGQMKYLKAVDKSKSGTVSKYKGKLNGFLDTQYARVSESLRKESGITAGTIDIIFPIQSEDEILKQTMKPLHTSSIQKAANDSNSLLGSAFDSSLNNPEVSVMLANLGSKVTRVNQTTKKAINSIIKLGVDNGLELSKIADDIEGLIGRNRQRALTIARTETNIAYRTTAKKTFEEIEVKTFDIVGCVGTVMPGFGIGGRSAGYGTQDEVIGNCGILDIPMRLFDSIEHHPNHQGTEAPRLQS